jgi:hypothetical protein
MEMQTLDKLYLEISQFTKAISGREYKLIKAIKLAYRKLHFSDDTLSDSEVTDALKDALCNIIGDEAFIEFSKSRCFW